MHNFMLNSHFLRTNGCKRVQGTSGAVLKVLVIFGFLEHFSGWGFVSV